MSPVTGGRQPINILLVEDNQAHAELVMRGFEDLPVPHRIFHVLDGAAALDFVFHRGEYAAAGSSPRPDLVLLDLRLPRVDGLEVLNHIKSADQLRSIPVIVLTTSSADADVRGAYQRHTNSYVVKPMDFSGFTRLTDDLGSYWFGHNHPAPA